MVSGVISIICLLLLHIHKASPQDLSSSKRGVIYVDTSVPADNHFWTAPRSDLTWGYNFASTPSSPQVFGNDALEFVPMLWGKPPGGDENFLDTVKGLIDGGMKIQYVLGFNEPDGCEGGGSCIHAKNAAQYWKDHMEPVKKLGVQLGAPAVTGSERGVKWLKDFLDECDGGCTIDFLPLHWYGPFQGLADYIGGMRAAYPNKPMWITEFAYPEVSLQESQAFYNHSTGFFDDLDYVKRYSYFGSFRSDVSNVGPNVAMLNEAGSLTDIGAWYLGRPATGVLPESRATTSTTFSGWLILSLALTALVAR